MPFGQFGLFHYSHSHLRRAASNVVSHQSSEPHNYRYNSAQQDGMPFRPIAPRLSIVFDHGLPEENLAVLALVWIPNHSGLGGA